MAPDKKVVWINRKNTDEKVLKFLSILPELRVDRRAQLASGLSKKLTLKLKENDPEFRKKYDEIHEVIRKTKKCSKCLSVYSNLNPEEKKTWKAFSVCRPCLSIQFNSYINSNEERLLKRLLVGIKSRGGCLTVEDLKDLVNKQGGKCFYTGEIMSMSLGPTCISIDRLNPKRGYSKDNIVACLKYVNLSKFTMSKEEFFEACNMVSNPSKESSDLLIPKSSTWKLIRDSRKRKLKEEHELGPNDITEMFVKQSGICFYTGVAMVPEKGANSFFQVSLERKDPSRGYSKNNSVLCCLGINRMKYDMDEEQFKTMCMKVVKARLPVS